MFSVRSVASSVAFLHGFLRFLARMDDIVVQPQAGTRDREGKILSLDGAFEFSFFF